MAATEREENTASEEIKAGGVKERAVSGIKALALRTGLSVLLRVVSSLCLAHLLFPRDYGVFGVAAYIAGLGMFLCDVGLGGALVRQHRNPTKDEAFTVFVGQQMITAFVVIALIAASPLLVRIYHLSSTATTLLVAMTGGLFLSSLRVIPMMALERALRFGDIARCEMLENIIQTGSAIALAWLGTGAWALAGSGLLRGVVGLGIVWAMSPWRPHGRFQWSIVKRLARFGLPFQFNALVPTLLGGWMPLAVSRLLGMSALGLVNWAINIASVPMMLSGILNRVAFPAFSRLQADPEALAQALRSSVRRLSAVFCLVVPVIVLACPVIIPALFHARWAPAVPLVQWFSLEAVVLTLNGVAASAQNASGRAGERLGVTIGIGLARWAFGYFAIARFGLMAIGPVMFVLSTLELAITASLVQRRNAACSRLLRDVFEPLGTVGALMLMAVTLSRVSAHTDTLWQSLVAVSVFILLMVFRELMTQGQAMTQEMRSVFTMFRGVKGVNNVA